MYSEVSGFQFRPASVSSKPERSSRIAEKGSLSNELKVNLVPKGLVLKVVTTTKGPER